MSQNKVPGLQGWLRKHVANSEHHLGNVALLPQQRPFHSGGHSGAQNEVGVAACALRHTERAKPLVTLNIHSLSFVNNYFLKSTFKISP